MNSQHASASTSGEESRGVIGTLRELVSEFQDDDVPGMAAEVAYHAIFSIPPVMIIFITLAAVLDKFGDVNLADRMRDLVNSDAPESTREILVALIENAVEQVDGGLASVGLATSLLIALWAGSNGVAALIKAFNRAYDTGEQRSFAKKRIVAIALTIALGLIVNLAFLLWVFGGQIGNWMARQFGMGSTFEVFWSISRWPLGATIIILMLMLLYYIAPNVDQTARWVVPGAVLSAALWLVLVLGFSIYLRFASPGSAYGALSGVIVFLFFLYLTSLVFILGAEFNAVLARRHDQVMIEDLAEEEKEAAEVAVELGTQPQRSLSTGQLAVGAATTVGVVLAGLVSRRLSK